TAASPDDAPPPPARSLGPLRMIWREMFKYPRQLTIAFLALLTSSAATLAIPYRFKAIIDDAFGAGADMAAIDRSFRYLMMIVLVLGLASAVRFYFVSWLGERVVADLRLRVQENLLRLSPGFFEENSPKEISSRMTSDTAIIEQVVGTTVSLALRNFITGEIGIILLFILAPVQSLYLVVVTFAIAMTMRLFGNKIRNVARASQDRVADVGAKVAEVLGAMKIVQGFNQEEREARNFQRAVEATFDTAKKRILLRAVMTALFITIVFGAITVLMWDGARSVAEGQISGGTIAAIVVVGVLVAGAFGALSEVYADLLRGAGAASRLNELLDEQPSIPVPARPQALPIPPRGSLAFQNVTFRYPTRPEQPAVSDFSLVVEPGET